QRGDRGESVQRGGALEPVRDDEELVDAAGAPQRRRRTVQGGHRVPRFHQEDGAEELLLGRLGHRSPQFVASLNRDRLRVSSSASFTRSSTVRRVWSTACSVCTASCVSAWTARMRAAMSLVALAARSASLRISSATTAKRTPDSPAPAASMAALSARRFVCDAISSIVSTISEISSERSPRLLIR